MHLNRTHALLLVTLLAGQGCSSSSDNDFDTGSGGTDPGMAGSTGKDGTGGTRPDRYTILEHLDLPVTELIARVADYGGALDD